MEPDLLSEAVSFVIDFHRADKILHLLGVRRVLEPAATALAAARIGEEDLVALRALLDEMRATSSVEAMVGSTRSSTAGSPSARATRCSLPSSMRSPRRRRAPASGAASRRRERSDGRTRSTSASMPRWRRTSPSSRARWATVHVAGVEHWLRVAAGTSDDGREDSA